MSISTDSHNVVKLQLNKQFRRKKKERNQLHEVENNINFQMPQESKT